MSSITHSIPHDSKNDTQHPSTDSSKNASLKGDSFHMFGYSKLKINTPLDIYLK